MTDIGSLCEELYNKIEWQKMPASTSSQDKTNMLIKAIVAGIEDLFVVTGRAGSYASYAYTYDECCGLISEFSYDLQLDEKLYVMCYAQMEIYKKVRTQQTELLGYTTNALSVTNADKPYAYVSSTIKELENQLKIYYYKMVRFSHLE